MEDEIIEALESSAKGKKARYYDGLETATKADIKLWRKRLMDFLGELDLHITVEEIRSALEDYE